MASRVGRGSGSAWLRLGLLVLLLASGVAVALTAPVSDRDSVLSALGRAPDPWLFGLVYAAATLAPVPKNVLSAAAGFFFGLGPGGLLVWGAALCGAATAFLLGRALGRDGVERLAHGHLARVDVLVDRYGGWAVLALRLVPVVPFTALNYGSGLTSLSFRTYLLATAVGIVPGTVAYVALGAYGTDPGSPPFLAAAGALLTLSVCGLLLTRRHRHRSPDPTAGASSEAPPSSSER